MKLIDKLAYESTERRRYMHGDFAKEAHRIGFILGYEAAILHVLGLNVHDEQKRFLIAELLTKEVQDAD